MKYLEDIIDIAHVKIVGFVPLTNVNIMLKINVWLFMVSIASFISSYSESVSLGEGRCTNSTAVTFDSTEDSAVSYVGVWPSTDISKRKFYSIACWVKLKSYQNNNDYQQVIYSDWMREKFILSIESGKVSFLIIEASNETLLWRIKTAHELIDLNKWTHVTATWDGHTITLYVNGEKRDGRNSLDLKPMNAYKSSVESAPAFIAGNPHFENYQFLGAIMDLYIFGIALPQDSVIKVYRGEWLSKLRLVNIDLVQVLCYQDRIKGKNVNQPGGTFLLSKLAENQRDSLSLPVFIK